MISYNQPSQLFYAQHSPIASNTIVGFEFKYNTSKNTITGFEFKDAISTHRRENESNEREEI